MDIFNEESLSAWLDARRQQLNEEVVAADRDYLLNVNETQYVDYLADKWFVHPIELHFGAKTISDNEKRVPAVLHSQTSTFGDRTQTFQRQVVRYHVPFSGNARLLRYRPSSRLVWSQQVNIEDGCVVFELVNWRDKAGEVEHEAGRILANMGTQVGNVMVEVNAFNKSLPVTAKFVVEGRKKQLLTQLNTLAALGVPIRQNDSVPATFAVPVTPSKPIVRPSAPSQSFAPEPTLDVQTYHGILKMIHDYGVEMERHPSIYEGKGEEALRDHFVMMLSPQFDSTTGETFNKSGKTDILIRHEGKNVFVAECKFWRGIKRFYETIDQLLGYLTWRDSKAAVICFVDNKELNPVLEQAVAETPNHPCFVKDWARK